MARNEDLYRSAAALGQTERPAPPKPQRLDSLLLRLRDGTELYYSYRFISAVKVTPAGELIIDCTCGNIKTITVRGLNLRLVAPMIANAQLDGIQERDNPKFTEPNSVVATEIVIKTAERR